MKITQQEVEKTARLARLELSAAEAERMTAQLDIILSYAAKLDAVDTAGVAAFVCGVEGGNAFRQDETQPSLLREMALKNSPQQDGQAFVVPKVIG